MKFAHYLVMTALLTGVAARALSGSGVEMILTRVPEGGLQPQALVGSDGTLHLIYFRGDPKAGDLFYARRATGSGEFTKPIRVNAQPGAAIAIGTIRGPQMALGKNGGVHVAWNGSGKASTHPGAPMLYTRLNNNGTAFEPERDVMTFTGGLDGGGSVAADENGDVYVAWHGSATATDGNETDRAVFVAISTNEGRTFGREQRVNREPTGACGCCGMKAFAAADGNLYLLYRAARGGVDRDAVLLASSDRGKTFRGLYVHPWKVTTCPMSSAWLGSAGTNGTIAAWETMGRVWFSPIDRRETGGRRSEVGGRISARPLTYDLRPPVAVAPAGGGGQKHPVAVANATGETLLVWAEGTGWEKGGTVAWQLFDSQGKPTETVGRKEGLPVWSFAAALARPDGDFEIIY